MAIVDRGRVLAAGRLDELLGEPALRIRATGVQAAVLKKLASFGSVGREGEWLSIQPIDPAVVPEVVAAIVGAGGRVHAVEAGRSSLEDRFLALLAEGSAQPTVAGR